MVSDKQCLRIHDIRYFLYNNLDLLSYLIGWLTDLMILGNVGLSEPTRTR